jgi:hypothetical protein
MSTKKLLFLLSAVVFAFTCTVQAQNLNGSLTATTFPGDIGFATDSSLSMFNTNIIQTATGNFNGTVPISSLLTATTATIEGLSTTPLTDPINNFFVFSSSAPHGPNGTTPQNRFEFNLQTITEDSFVGGVGEFSGTGTIVDITGAFANTSADFTLDFNGPSPNSYTITLATVPEPATVSLVALGLAGTVALRRRRA